MSWLWMWLWICLIYVGSVRASSGYYQAAVVEYRPAASNQTSADQLAENLSAYLALIEVAKVNQADIVVFPEATLNSYLQLTAVPATGATASLCQGTESDEYVASFMRSLSCAAIEAATYLVFNVKERANCENEKDCPTCGYLMYNTNVVLDRSGAVVSRYRKWHLYMEPMLNRTAQPEYAIFSTDFNVTFGHFVCFDMLFYTPAQELVERYQVEHVIVTKMFNSELPFLTASQLQQSWAMANDVNLLAAGASLPQAGISGSGIYAGRRGALTRLMVGNATVGMRQLLVARVPKSPRLNDADIVMDVERPGPAQHMLPLGQEPKLQYFNTSLLPLVMEPQQLRLCSRDLCCTIEYTLSDEGGAVSSPLYRYRFGSYVGNRSYEQAAYSYIRLCGLFACRNDSIESCAQLQDQQQEQQVMVPLEFSKLRVSGEFVQRDQQLIMPNTLSSALYALQATEFSWESSQVGGNSILFVMELKKPHSQLLTFAIYGNYFNETHKAEGDGATGVTIALASIVLSLVISILA